jgi:hypothetical protein
MEGAAMRRYPSDVGRGIGLLAVSLALAVTGCRPATPGGGGALSPAPRPEEPEAPKGEALADPILREARDQADTIVGGLLAGEFDSDRDLWPVARKVKGYRSHSIRSQEIAREGAVDFRGVLTGPSRPARFAMTLVKQKDGKWAIGTFSGPEQE